MTKMKPTIAVLVAAAGLVLPSGAAQAIPSLSIIWRSTGTDRLHFNTVDFPLVSSTVVADIVLTADVEPILGVAITIEFTTTALEAVSAKELFFVNLPSMGNSFRPGFPGTLIDNQLGLVELFDQFTLSTGLVGGTRTLGSVTFHVRPTVSSGRVVASLQGNDEGIFTTGGEPIDANFNLATITGDVPEPATAVLLLAGIAGLAYARRKSLR